MPSGTHRYTHQHSTTYLHPWVAKKANPHTSSTTHLPSRRPLKQISWWHCSFIRISSGWHFSFIGMERMTLLIYRNTERMILLIYGNIKRMALLIYRNNVRMTLLSVLTTSMSWDILSLNWTWTASVTFITGLTSWTAGGCNYNLAHSLAGCNLYLS